MVVNDAASLGFSAQELDRLATESAQRVIDRARNSSAGFPRQPVTASSTQKTVLQTDFDNVVGSPTAGYVQVEVTLAADGTLKFYSEPGGGGGGGEGAESFVVMSMISLRV